MEDDTLDVAAAAADDHMTMDLANEARQASEPTTAFLADDSIFKANDESTIQYNNDSIVSSTKFLGAFDKKDAKLLAKFKNSYAPANELNKIVRANKLLRQQQQQNHYTSQHTAFSKHSQKRVAQKSQQRLSKFHSGLGSMKDI